MIRSLKINALLNGIRQSLSFLFPLITFPYVIRRLGVIEYGKYSFAVSVISYFSLIAAFGISKFAIREGARIREDKEKIFNFTSKIFSFNIITTALAYTLLLTLVYVNTKLSQYSTLIIIQSISIILTTIGIDWLNTVYEDFMYITIRYIVAHIIGLVFIFLLIKSPSDLLLYCIIMLFSSYGGNIFNIFYTRKYVCPIISFNFNFRTIFIPTLLFFISSIATTIYVNSDITMIGLYLDDYNVGLYGFSSKLYNVIKYFFDALIIVAVPRFSYLIVNNSEKYEYYINIIFKLVAYLIFPVTIFIYLMSNSIVNIIGGISYVGGIPSFKILSFSLIFALMGSVCCNCCLILHQKEKYVLISTMVSALVNVLLNLIMIPRIGIRGAAITTLLSEALNFFIQYYFSIKQVEKFTNISIKNITSIIFMTSLTISICVITNQITSTSQNIIAFMKIFFSCITIATISLLFLYFFNDEILLFMIGKKKFDSSM